MCFEKTSFTPQKYFPHVCASVESERESLKFYTLWSDILHHLFSKFSTLSDTVLQMVKPLAAQPRQSPLSHALPFLDVIS